MREGAAAMTEIRTAVLQFNTRREFEENYLPDLPEGGVFVETVNDYFVGEQVELYLCFPEIPQGVPLRGTVIWRRPPTKWRSALRPGIGVRFDPSDQEQRDFLLSFCNGDLDAKRGRNRRVPADFRVEFSTTDTWVAARALNISRDGLFITTDATLPLNSLVQMKLFLDESAPPDLYFGRVAWQCDETTGSGIGVEFKFKSPIRRKKIHRFVEKSEDKLIQRIPQIARSTRRFERPI